MSRKVFIPVWLHPRANLLTKAGLLAACVASVSLAAGDEHWSFVAPQDEDPPQISDADWSRRPIDRFIRARLEKEGLRPAPPADRATLIRRVTLDLIGLPATPAEVAAFAADNSPEAWEKVVDRLLSSPHYGERMAIEWLDAARYADTHGYLFDTERQMWRWRDWVIDAYNRDLPFDEFTVEQLAGDLLPDADLEQRVATGFNRNHIINNEAGAIPQEYLVENIVDRVDTTASVWLGLTVACARCHDHKYDPITHEEYYELYAFFDNVPERGLDGLNSNAAPILRAPSPQYESRLRDLDRRIAERERKLKEIRPRIREQQERWERDYRRPVKPVSRGRVAHWSLDEPAGDAPTTESTITFRASAPRHAAGVFGESASLDGIRHLDAGDVGGFERSDSFTFSAWVFPTEKKGRRAILSRMLDTEKGFRGYALQLVEGFAAFYLIHRFPDNLINVQTKKVLEPNRWHHVLVRYDGSSKAKGVEIWVDGEKETLSYLGDTLRDSISTKEPLYIGKGHPVAMFKGRIDEVRVWDRALEKDEIGRIPGVSIHSLLARDRASRSPFQTRRIERHYLANHAPARWKKMYESIESLRSERARAGRNLPTVMVMRDRTKATETRVLKSGRYDRPGAVVRAGTPRFLPAMADGLPRDRLGLARWLVDESNPLTARVAVNRFWQRRFGSGLVATPEDLGTRAAPPSHPALLDWLARALIRDGWGIKSMQRRIATSMTYRQSTRVPPRLLERDPRNRFLARGARFRLPAELIRDQALASSGLLVGSIGGRSVRPYQPADLWKEVAFDTSGANLTAQVYQQGTGEDLYRRSLYTFWKRTSPPPSMLLFDAPDRERCVLSRERTNTPLQALVVMNSPTFVEAARRLAERMLEDRRRSSRERVGDGFRRVLARSPSRSETEILVGLLDKQIVNFRKDTSRATDLLEVGESRSDPSLDPAELAAYTTVASVILNLDEALTRN